MFFYYLYLWKILKKGDDSMKKKILLIIFIQLCIYTTLSFAQYIPDITLILSAEAVMGPTTSYSLFDFDPYSEIHILGDKIYLPVHITDGENNTNIILHYKSSIMEEYEQINFSPKPSGSSDYYGSIEISPEKQGLGTLYFYVQLLNTINGVDNVYGSSNFPKIMNISQENSTTITKKGGILKLQDGNPDDGENCLDVSENAVVNNNLKMKQIYPVPKEAPYQDCVALYKIGPDHTVFNNFCSLTLLYFDLNNDGKIDNTSIQEDQLKMCWYDGFEWRNIGGKVDEKKNTVQSYVIQTGLYGLIPADKVKQVSIKPLERIITPNEDGMNDHLFFNGVYGDFTIKIFNINGHIIRSISDLPFWDGKDSDNNYVPIGIYLYVIKVGDQKINGVCAVAR